MHPRLTTLSVTLALLLSCSASEYSKGDAAADTGWAEADGDVDTDTDSDTDADADADWDDDASEVEDDFLALRPAQTDVYVFVANPNRNTVTRINVNTHEVLTTEVGSDPRLVKTTPDYQRAVVFNRLDDSLSLIDAHTLDQRVVPVRKNFNNMVMSPDGVWVALWHDVANERPDDPPVNGLLSFNEASFVNTITGEHYPMAVEYNPRDIVFTEASETAVVVSDRALAVVDLTVGQLAAPTIIEVADDTLEPPPAEELVLSPSGEFAFVRQFGSDSITIVDLFTRDVSRVPVGINPTDLDLTPDGLSAVVVTRDSRELWVLDSENPLNPPRVVPLPPEYPLGSVLFAPDNSEAVIYTTANLIDRYVTWDPATDAVETHALVKPLQSLTYTPTGETLLAFHTLADAADAPTSPFTGEWALSLIDAETHVDFPLLLPAQPTGYANANNGRYGYFIMENENFLEVLNYGTRLHEDVPLGSAPVYVGVLPDLDASDNDEPSAWVSQEHDLGRITFYDPDSGATETITGFELNSQIED